jgi:predicted AAA+ superfamily ATPase
MTALASLRGTVVVDEIQRRPDLFTVLRVLADRRPARTKFLLLGSASGALMRQSSESLAGRVEVVECGGFTMDEVGGTHGDRLWRRGGFPRAFLAKTERDSVAWREQFVRTFLERDLPQRGTGASSINCWGLARRPNSNAIRGSVRRGRVSL